MPQLTLSEERVNILIDALGTYWPYSLLVGTEIAAKGLRNHLRRELYKAKKAKEPEDDTT